MQWAETCRFSYRIGVTWIEAKSTLCILCVCCYRNSGLPLYKTQLETIKAFLARPEPEAATQEEVYSKLGHGISAAEAVPCAVFAFLHCAAKNFEHLIPYAISLGGDTDTIASMAGAIGGAYWGIEGIPPDWVKAGEATDAAVTLADQLHEIVWSDG